MLTTRSALLVSLAFSFACSPAPSTPPNVLLIVVDTLRADHLSYNGYPSATTPELDKLASQSLNFERAYATAAWTRPSIASILTGLDPLSHGANSIDRRLPEELETLAESFESAGFITGGIVSNVHLLEEVGFRQGFQFWNQEHAQGHTYVSSQAVTDAAIATLDAFADEPAPWFLFVHYFDPHYAYQDHPDYTDAPATTALFTGNEPMSELNKNAHRMNARDLAVLIGRYDEEIRLTDKHIGRLLKRLQEVDDNTLIGFTADHGEELGERGAIGHRTLYEEVIRVPLLLRPPGGTQGRTVSTPVSLLSLAPTLLELAHVPFEPSRFGAGSLAAWVSGTPETKPNTPIFSETYFKRSVSKGRYKLMRDEEKRSAALYDVIADPSEQNNLIRERPAVAKQLAGLLKERSGKTRKATETYQPAPEMLEQLRALGYAEDEPTGERTHP